MLIKYVMFDECLPVIFSAALHHKEVAALRSEKPTGAGFVHFGSNEITVFGESTSLGIGPGQSDEAIIRQMIGGRK